MKLTLDRVCITSGKLCANCQEMLDNGEISQLDIDIGKVLLNIAKSQRFLSNVTVNQIIETKSNVYLIVKKGDLDKFIQGGEHLKTQLRKVKNKRYTFIEKTKNAKQLLSILLDPVVPMGNSTVLLPPDGEKEIKIQIKNADKDKLTIDSIELSEITHAILGMAAHYAYV